MYYKDELADKSDQLRGNQSSSFKSTQPRITGLASPDIVMACIVLACIVMAADERVGLA